MGDKLAELEALIGAMSPHEIEQLDKQIADELAKPFLPTPGPQTDALNSVADILLFGGSAGGGKSALEIGAFFSSQHSGIVFRREGTQLDGLIEFCKQIGEPAHGRFVGGNDNVFKRHDGGRLKFAGLKEADDWRKHAGNARDYIAFDEAGEFLREQVMSLIGWLRSTREGQRCRVILGSNPPRGGDGEWMIEEFAPWLDPLYSNPARSGELRWAIVVAGKTEWVQGPGEYTREGEHYGAMSRTFIPSRLEDNPYLRDTGYRAKLQALPEPLRSQLLKGDFLAGRKDHEWQVIPTEWVRLANERWNKAGSHSRQMIALAADVALGGGDPTVMAPLYAENWFGHLISIDTDKPAEIAAQMLLIRRNEADLSVDGTGGWGSGVRSQLTSSHGIECASIVFSSASNLKTQSGQLGFANLRAEMWWKFREALDPESGEDIKLPVDPKLMAELTTPRYRVKGTNILIEEKAEVRKRVGSSTDRADAVIMAWKRRLAFMKVQARKTRPALSVSDYEPSQTGWMG